MTPEHRHFIAQMMNPWKFRLYLLMKVPLGLIAGMRLKSLDLNRCEATIRYRWINTNPFKSMYFAALAMAAELSNGSLALLATYNRNPSVAVIIVAMEAQFLKKATGLITFTCEEGASLFAAADRAQQTGEPVTQKVQAIGRAEDGTEVARFAFTWSFKRRG
ncbi:MAG: thioesterase [Chitinophagales bacterium]|nr:MAG: thioesterase [Chitinophagales bacterium]